MPALFALELFEGDDSHLKAAGILELIEGDGHREAVVDLLR